MRAHDTDVMHFVARVLNELFQEGRLTEVASVEVEPEWGYKARVTYRSGVVRLTSGNDVGVNPGAAVAVAKDKAHSKHFLRASGFRVPDGREFLVPWWAERIGAEAPGPPTDVGFPVYVKPVHGSMGFGVARCHDEDELRAAIAEVEASHAKVVMVEEAIDLPDYRLVVLHGEVVFAYLREPLAVIGDGRASIAELAAERGEGERVTRSLKRRGLALESVPASGETVLLHDVSNLAAGGTATDVSDRVHERWRQVAIDAAAALGLHFCGVDLAARDISTPDGGYAILEVNGTPGLGHYAAVGRAQDGLVRDLYARLLNTPPAGS